MEQVVCCSKIDSSQEEGACHAMQGFGEAPRRVRRQRDREESVGEGLCCGYLGKEWVKQFRIG